MGSGQANIFHTKLQSCLKNGMFCYSVGIHHQALADSVQYPQEDCPGKIY